MAEYLEEVTGLLGEILDSNEIPENIRAEAEQLYLKLIKEL